MKLVKQTVWFTAEVVLCVAAMFIVMGILVFTLGRKP